MRRDPTPENIQSPLFKAIWQVIRHWDADTDGQGYHECTGTDVMEIVEAICEETVYRAVAADTKARLQEIFSNAGSCEILESGPMTNATESILLCHPAGPTPDIDIKFERTE